MDDTKNVLEKDHEGPTGTREYNVDDEAASRHILSEAEDISDDEA